MLSILMMNLSQFNIKLVSDSTKLVRSITIVTFVDNVDVVVSQILKEWCIESDPNTFDSLHFIY